MNFVACKLADIPAIGNPENPHAKLLLEFLESKEEAAEVFSTGYSLNSAGSNLRGIINRNDLPIKVIQRQKRLFLLRLDSKKEGKGNEADS